MVPFRCHAVFFTMIEPTTDDWEVYLPVNRARLWGEGHDDKLKDQWYTPVVYQNKPIPGFRKVRVPSDTLEGGWFHPDRHEDLPALAELLS